jgi:hypothetical protein
MAHKTRRRLGQIPARRPFAPFAIVTARSVSSAVDTFSANDVHFAPIDPRIRISRSRHSTSGQLAARPDVDQSVSLLQLWRIIEQIKSAELEIRR